ncbi:MAG: leucine--tRNA ligase [Magnetococcus sp. DMHC-6]
MNDIDDHKKKYNPQSIEAKWQSIWDREKTFQAQELPDRKKYYLLVMFPYPSGRIHMGHVRNYTIGDLMARYQRRLGHNVLHPMGWDAFGMPAENAAIKQGVHPKAWTLQNIATMRKEIKSMGISYDWDRELATCDPEYAHWEQVLFVKLYEKGLVYRKKSLVNWDPVDHTVLANEQVIDGKGWRSGATVERRELSQWFLRITAYADELLADLDQLSGWPETVRTMQANWIGKSQGLEFFFHLKGHPGTLPVYTTRPDTLMGVTFCSIAPEHPLAKEVAQHNPAAEAFIRECQKCGTSEEALERLEKKGFHSGLFAIHPITGEEIPIFIANFVLMGYGTGAVMAVPAHDQRDFEFARSHSLPVRVVIQPPGVELDPATMTEAYTGPGLLVHSGQFTGLESETAKKEISTTLESLGKGKITVHFRLRDWGISRQRYWGNPIPMIHCPTCGVVAVPITHLPVPLPDDLWGSSEAIGNPLALSPDWKKTTCPLCQGAAQRETDTMDTFMESSWYFLRYCCPDLKTAPLDRQRVDYWLPVDHYVGGIEHAVLHLLYARFFHKALRDVGEVSGNEPFTRLLTQGMVRKDTHFCPNHGWRYPMQVKEQGEGLLCCECDTPIQVGRNEKMSKSKHNVIDPNDIIQNYGADTARLFMLFAAPADRDLEWNDRGVDGAWRFLNRLWRLVRQIGWQTEGVSPATCMPSTSLPARKLRTKVHQTIVKVTQDLDRNLFNTGIAAVMELVNEASLALGKNEEPMLDELGSVLREAALTAVMLLNPYVPHITEELWRDLGQQDPLSHHSWPQADPLSLVQEEITIVVQVNGKLRATLTHPKETAQADMEIAASNLPQICKLLEGKTIHKVIVVPSRLINFVTN